MDETEFEVDVDEFDGDVIEFAFYPIFNLDSYGSMDRGGSPIDKKRYSYNDKELKELSNIFEELDTSSRHLRDINTAMRSNIWMPISYFGRLTSIWGISVFRMLLMIVFIAHDIFISDEPLIGNPVVVVIPFFIIFIYEHAYRNALYAKEYLSFTIEMDEHNSFIRGQIAELNARNRGLLLAEGQKFYELKKRRNWGRGLGG